ncbi:MAG: DUF2125 domain-containing protein [Alphaproteobacteria bacterium]
MRIARFLIGAALFGALAWTGWWYALARGQEAALEAWFAERTRAGWQAEHDGIDLVGFPLRLEREIAGIRLADPDNGWAWTAPWLRVESATFSPNRIEVTWPGDQSLSVPGERTDIASSTMAATLELRPGLALGLIHASAKVARLDVRSRSGWTARAGSVAADIAERVNDDGYALTFRAERVLLPEPLMARIDPTGLAGREIERMTFDGAAVFAAPLDRYLIEDGRLALRAATIRRAGFQWGRMRLEAKGAIRIDARGYPDGKIKVTAKHWREIIALALRSGAIGTDMAEALTTALELLALLGGDRDKLDATFRFSDGQVWLGPLSIGRAWRLAPARG